MTSPERRKGNAFEVAIAQYLRDHGHPYAERAYGAGRPDDRGDIDGIPGFVLSAKNQAQVRLGVWMNEVETQRVNARASFAALIVKRRGAPVDRAYVVLDLATFAALMTEEPIA